MSAALLAGCSGGGSAPPGPMDQVISFEHYDHALLSAAIFKETNRVRKACGVPHLEPLRPLDEAADAQASHMALMMRAGHSNLVPSEHTITDRVSRVGVYWTRIAENVLMEPANGFADNEREPTYTSLAEFLVNCWMNSPEHRANLVDPNFTYLGCGARISHGGRGEEFVFASQVFVLRVSEPPIPD
jgi:uncharacterized protein YkwD